MGGIDGGVRPARKAVETNLSPTYRIHNRFFRRFDFPNLLSWLQCTPVVLRKISDLRDNRGATTFRCQLYATDVAAGRIRLEAQKRRPSLSSVLYLDTQLEEDVAQIGSRLYDALLLEMGITIEFIVEEVPMGWGSSGRTFDVGIFLVK